MCGLCSRGTHVLYVFADCELDTQLYILRRAGQMTLLRPKVFQVLIYLLEHRDRVVSKHELLEAVWPKQFISDATLADCIRTIRHAVGDSRRHQSVLQTRHVHGYRFVAEVTEQPAGHEAQPEPDTSATLAPPISTQTEGIPVLRPATPPELRSFGPAVLASRHCPECQTLNAM